MAESSRDSGSAGFSGRGFLRSLEHEAGLARGNGVPSILIPLGHFAIILFALFIVSNAARESGESRGIANSALDQAKTAIVRADQDKRDAMERADKAEKEARIEQSKTESLRNEVSELRGMMLGKPKEK